MKFVLVVTSIVTFANGHVDQASSHTKVIPTQYANYHQCEYNGERYVEREIERLTNFLASQGRGVNATFQCTKLDSE